MKLKKCLTSVDVKNIIRSAENEALKNNWSVTIAVVDDGGHLMALQRLDGAAPLSSYISIAKAKTASLGQKETKIFEDMINNGRFAFLSVPYVDGTLEGGVPIIIDGICIGAVGVSGVKSDQDVQVARVGIKVLSS